MNFGCGRFSEKTEISDEKCFDVNLKEKLKNKKMLDEKVKLVHQIEFNFQKSEVRSILDLGNFLKSSEN